MKKTCSRCRMDKETSEFPRAKRYKDGYYCWCKDCSREYRREKQRDPSFTAKIKEKRKRPEIREGLRVISKRYAKLHPEERRRASRNQHLKASYGITSNEFERLQAEQGGRCACCGEIPEKVLNVDHDHETDQVRGLICYRCNQGIAYLGDNRDGVAKALAYLSPKKVTYEPFTFIA